MPHPYFHPAPIVLVLAFAFAMPMAQAQVPAARASATTFSISLAAQPLGSALNELARQAKLQLLVHPDLVAGKSAPGVTGELTARQALDRLLDGSGLSASMQGNTVIVKEGVLQSGAALPVVLVQGDTERNGTTEGSGAYAATGPSSSATRLGLDVRDTPQSISVITRQQMDDQRLGSVVEVLETTVGITNFRQGVGVDLDQIYARGFLVSNYLIDGVPTTSDTNALRMNTAMFDRVEVVRGATGLMSGLGDPGAAINLVRKRPSGEAQSSIDVEAGNWSRYGLTLDLSRPLNDSGTARARIVADFKDRASWLDRFKSKTAFMYGTAEFDLDRDTLLTVGFNYQNNDNDAPMRTGAPIYYSNGSRINLPRSYNARLDLL